MDTPRRLDPVMSSEPNHHFIHTDIVKQAPQPPPGEPTSPNRPTLRRSRRIGPVLQYVLAERERSLYTMPAAFRAVAIAILVLIGLSFFWFALVVEAHFDRTLQMSWIFAFVSAVLTDSILVQTAVFGIPAFVVAIARMRRCIPHTAKVRPVALHPVSAAPASSSGGAVDT